MLNMDKRKQIRMYASMRITPLSYPPCLFALLYVQRSNQEFFYDDTVLVFVFDEVFT